MRDIIFLFSNIHCAYDHENKNGDYPLYLRTWIYRKKQTQINEQSQKKDLTNAVFNKV